MSTEGILGSSSQASNVQQSGETHNEASKPELRSGSKPMNITTLDQMKQEAPELYDALMQSLAERFGNRLQKHQEKMKQIRHDAEREQAG